MLATTHTLAGATIAVAFPGHPWLMAPLAILSHLVLDAIPHWNFPLAKRLTPQAMTALAPEFIGMAVVVGGYLMFFPHLWLQVLLGAFFSILPDIITEIREIFGKDLLVGFTALHERIQYEIRPLEGLLTQMITAGALLWLTLSL